MAWRTTSDEALDEAARRVEDAGVTGVVVTTPASAAVAPTSSPDRAGHTMPPFWDVEQVPGRRRARLDLPRPPRETLERRAVAPALPRPRHHRGPRRARRSPQWYRDVLGFRIMAYTDARRGPRHGLRRHHDEREVARPRRRARHARQRPGRINHYAFWVDTREDLLIAADVLMENGTAHRVRPVDPRHRRAELPLLPRPQRPAHRGQHRRLPQLRARLGGQHWKPSTGLEQPVPQRRHADVDDRVVPARRGPPHRRPRRASCPAPRRRCSTPTASTARAEARPRVRSERGVGFGRRRLADDRRPR